MTARRRRLIIAFALAIATAIASVTDENDLMPSGMSATAIVNMMRAAALALIGDTNPERQAAPDHVVKIN